MNEAMTVEQAIELVRLHKTDNGFHYSTWGQAALVLADEVERLRSELSSVTEANSEYHRDALALEQERDLLRACLEHVVNVYLVDDYYGAEDRETLIKRYIDRLMAEQRDKMSEGKNHE